jgi:hypothetical protein
MARQHWSRASPPSLLDVIHRLLGGGARRMELLAAFEWVSIRKKFFPTGGENR